MQSPFVAWSIDDLMKQQNVSTFMIYPARNWTFEGIFDGMMEAVTDPDASVMFPVTVPWDKFGWFYPVSIPKKDEKDANVGFWRENSNRSITIQ